MTEIELNKGIKVKKYQSYQDKKKKYPFDKMEIGDWFTVEEKDHNSIRSFAHIVGKKEGKKFSTHKRAGLITVERVK